MSQIFNEQSNQIPVTIIEAGPCMIVQVKNNKKDGYLAVQMGFEKTKKLNKLNKPEKGHFKGLGEEFKYLKEIRLKENITSEKEIIKEEKEKKSDNKKEEEPKEKIFDLNNLKRKDKIDVSIFTEGEKVNVIGVSKGKGFTGVVKRYGFSKGPETHGSRHHRKPGSIGSMYPQRVVKGKKLPGRSGADQVTIKNLQVIRVDLEKNLLAVKGAIPGVRGSLLVIKSS